MLPHCRIGFRRLHHAYGPELQHPSVPLDERSGRRSSNPRHDEIEAMRRQPDTERIRKVQGRVVRGQISRLLCVAPAGPGAHALSASVVTPRTASAAARGSLRAFCVLPHRDPGFGIAERGTAMTHRAYNFVTVGPLDRGLRARLAHQGPRATRGQQVT